MDRRNARLSLNRESMCSRWISSLQLLLRADPSQRRRSSADETGRRDLYCQTMPRVTVYYRDTATGRPQGQPETDPGRHERVGLSRESAGPQYVQKPPRTPKVPIPAQRSANHQAIAGLEHRHHVHTPSRRFCVPRCGHRLVQPVSACKSPLKLSGGQFLRRGVRGSRGSVRLSGDFQYGSGSAVFHHKSL